MEKILIVDDDAQTIEYVSRLLDNSGYTSEFIAKPKFLFDILESESFDLILMDVYMPEISGLDLLKQLKEHPKYDNIPVIMLTSDADDQLLAKCFENGAEDFINKPIRELVFKSRVKSAIAKQRYIRQVKEEMNLRRFREHELLEVTQHLLSIPGYRFLEIVGMGANTKVYKVRNELSGRLEALKMIYLASNIRQHRILKRFRQEVEALTTLKNTYPQLAVTEIYSFKEEKDFLYYTMKYLEGDSLEDLLRKEKLSIEQSLKIFKELIYIIERAHDLGMIHRDIKPANIVIDSSDKTWLIDFSISKLANKRLVTTSKEFLGTLCYASPEQLHDKEITPQSDIFSLGMVFYEMLTGERLVPPAPLQQMLHTIINGQWRFPSSIRGKLQEKGLAQICTKMLSASLEKRYANIQELKLDLEKID